MTVVRGIEEIIKLLPLKINNKNVKLVLKGFLRPDYEKMLKKLVEGANITDEVEFIGLTPYQEIANITCSCHIGIAIFSKNDVMNQTLGTASNKIYEYAACSLPILYYNNAHFTHHLGHLNWAFGTDVSNKSLISSIEEIDNNYDQLSASAKKSYLEDLNFEHHFQPVVEFLNAN